MAPVVPKDVTNLDIVKAWIDTLPSERPLIFLVGMF